MKINPNVCRRQDGVDVDIFFPFPVSITHFRNVEEARRFFEIRAGYIPSYPELYKAYYSAYRVLAEAEFYHATLGYLCKIEDRLIFQLDFSSCSSRDEFIENVQKL